MQKYAVLGYPVVQSISPQIHNPAFKRLNINAIYEKIEIFPENLDNTIHEFKKTGYNGFNVTLPYKQSIIRYLDEIDPVAKQINAVNTIQVNSGKWKGFNTDVYGFMLPLNKQSDSIKNTLIIGSGGAAHAVLFATLMFKSLQNIDIVNRTIGNAENLKDHFLNSSEKKIHIYDFQMMKTIRTKYDLIINTTNIGMGKLRDKNPMEITTITHPQSIIYDLIYKPMETLFLKQAKKLSLQTINGMPMLIGQAKKSFELWTGQKFPGEPDPRIFQEN